MLHTILKAKPAMRVHLAEALRGPRIFTWTRLASTEAHGGLSAEALTFSLTRADYLHHPWLEKLPQTHGLDKMIRYLTFLTGTCTQGNLANLSRTWAFTPAHMHKKGTEAVILCLPSAGMPKLLNGLTAIENMGVVERAIEDLPIDKVKDLLSSNRYSQFFQRGEKEMKALMGHKYERLRHHVRLLHPALDRWTVEVLYGRLMLIISSSSSSSSYYY
eukprot:g32233.t1